MSMNLIVITPEKELYNGPAKSVKVPGTTGHFEVLAGHAPLVSSLKEGNVRVIKQNDDQENFPISGGFIEVLRNEVSVLVMTQTAPEEDQ